ncbi:alanine--tRNA ligase, partial [Chamaesiphon sp. GL140_3_metabinner_50]|uniref:alanine--tRNA ligase n=1 Tax=Chamaesiphon sp. GL140_3_metabinner_50 TaxID=2970812 RepID=UPI0025D0309E
NNYETDLIFPIVQTAADIAGIDYFSSDEKTKTSLKVIGDHIRAIVHMNADGIRASNVGRGYILRRLLRRVVRHGRSIGIDDHFTTKVAETAIALSESAYPNVRSKADSIKAELQREETQFLKTLERGEKLLADLVTDVKAKGIAQISGADAFKLYGTYGFPLELTQEIAEEQDLTVDVEGYDRAKEEDIKNTPDPHGEIDLTVQGTLDSFAEHLQATEFVGYKSLNSRAEVVALLVGGVADTEADAGTNVQIILDKSPFYAESGGQIGDRGYLSGDNLLVRIDDVKKESAFFVHFGSIERGNLRVGDTITAQIDTACRRRAQANHTATHLLQAALKLLVDSEISQAGSLVSFDRLRFDFNCPRALTPVEVQQVEELVNTWITEAHSAEIEVMPIAQARAKGAVAMFGEKYGDEVRVIDFPGVSMELCGGIHVNNTAEIGAFKIISEAGVAAGVRRIEAVAGNAILDYLNVRDRVVKELGERFKAKPEELIDRVSSLQAELKANQKQLEAVKGELAIAKSDRLLAQAQSIGEFKLIIAELGDVDATSLQTAAERLLDKLGEGAIVLASVPEPDKVSLVAAFSKGVNAKGLQAGKFIGNIAKICGGGGGGRSNLAQAGGRDASKVKEALAVAKAELEGGLG